MNSYFNNCVKENERGGGFKIGDSIVSGFWVSDERLDESGCFFSLNLSTPQGKSKLQAL